MLNKNNNNTAIHDFIFKVLLNFLLTNGRSAVSAGAYLIIRIKLIENNITMEMKFNEKLKLNNTFPKKIIKLHVIHFMLESA